MLESGNVKSLKEIAKRESVATRLRDPYGQPDCARPGDRGGDLDETLPADVTLFDLAVDPPALWEEQRRRIRILL